LIIDINIATCVHMHACVQHCSVGLQLALLYCGTGFAYISV